MAMIPIANNIQVTGVIDIHVLLMKVHDDYGVHDNRYNYHFRIDNAKEADGPHE